MCETKPIDFAPLPILPITFVRPGSFSQLLHAGADDLFAQVFVAGRVDCILANKITDYLNNLVAVDVSSILRFHKLSLLFIKDFR